MKWLHATILVAASSSLMFVSVAFAQEPEGVKEVDLLAWATSTPPNWEVGVVLAISGLVGALITIFTFVGGAVPGTAGQARIDADFARLQGLEEELEARIKNPTANPALIEAVGKMVNELRDDVRSERWRQFAIATFLYAVLGAAMAALIAEDVLEALVIGAGWTGLLGSLGLKRDFEERKEVKDKALEKSKDRINQVEQLVKTSANPALINALPQMDPWLTEMKVAQAI